MQDEFALKLTQNRDPAAHDEGVGGRVCLKANSPCKGLAKDRMPVTGPGSDRLGSDSMMGEAQRA
jgi:hypothetical protein